MKSHNRAIRQGVAPTPQSYQQLPTPVRLACWSSLGSSAAYCQNKTRPRPTMIHRLGGVPQQGFVEQDPVLAAQVHSDLALDYLSQFQDHCVWILLQQRLRRASFIHFLLNFLLLASRLLPASYATITIPTSWLPTDWPGEESALWLPAAPCAEEYSPALAACPAALAACPCTSSCACLFEALAACPCAEEYSPALAACPEAMAACPCAED